MRSAILLAVLLSVSVPPGTRAQETDTLAASRVLSARSAPVVRPAEEVKLLSRSAAPPNLSELLRRFTGVQVKDYGGAGGLKTINVRSLGSEHVGVFMDGIQIDNAQNMQVDLGRFSTDVLESVSLYNAQKSVRLQTAKEYASGASVHLNSGSPDPANGNSGRVRFRAGSFGTVNPSLLWDKSLSPSLTLRSAAEFLGSNGRYRYPCFDTTLTRKNGDIKSLRLEAQLSGRLAGGSWQFRVYSYGSERGFPGPVVRRAAGFPFSAERQADQDLSAQGRWTQDWSSRYSTALRIKYADNYTHYATHPEKNPMALPYDLHYRQHSGYLSLAQSLAINDRWSVDLSTDIQYNSLDSDAGQFVHPKRTTFTGALATRAVWPRFRAAAHMAYTGAEDRFDTPKAGGWSRTDRRRHAWMPSVSVSWNPAGWMEADAFAKRTYRLPSFNDLYYSLIGNASLTPESAVQYGADLRLSLVSRKMKLAFRLSPYYNHVSDKIVAIPTSSQFRWTMLNIGQADITGVDAGLTADYAQGAWSLQASARYSFQQALDHSTPGSLTYGNQIPYIPLHSGSFSMQATWRKWSLAWDTTLTGHRWSRSANTSDYYLKAWSVSDLSLSRALTGSVHISLSLNNIFDARYQIVQGYPMPGFHAMTGIRYNW